MKLITLVENTACSENFRCVHGLSQYIETPKHKLLMDVGPDESFLENARVLGVDLAAVDTVILSHGHYDHTGGLEKFFAVNDTAKVYLRPAAFEPYYSCVGEKAKYIGMNEALKKYAPRFVFTEEMQVIDEELTLFSRVSTHDYRTEASDVLRRFDGENYVLDDFCHEQNLILSCEGKQVLLCGCAHSGIVNILRQAEEIIGRAPDAVFGGFHLFNPTTGAPESAGLIAAVASELLARDTKYFTGHCTGLGAYEQLKALMGSAVEYMSAGAAFTI